MRRDYRDRLRDVTLQKNSHLDGTKSAPATAPRLSRQVTFGFTHY